MSVTIFQYVDGITIKGHPKGLGAESGVCALLEGEDQEEVLKWFKRNKPVLCRKIFGE